MNKVKKLFFVSVYFAAFGFCMLPNIPIVKNVSYDEPQQHVLENEELIMMFDVGECARPAAEEKMLDFDRNITDYDSGDYGDY